MRKFGCAVAVLTSFSRDTGPSRCESVWQQSIFGGKKGSRGTCARRDGRDDRLSEGVFYDIYFVLRTRKERRKRSGQKWRVEDSKFCVVRPKGRGRRVSVEVLDVKLNLVQDCFRLLLDSAVVR